MARLRDGVPQPCPEVQAAGVVFVAVVRAFLTPVAGVQSLHPQQQHLNDYVEFFSVE